MDKKMVVIKARVNGVVVTLFYAGDDRLAAWKKARKTYSDIISVKQIN